MNDCNNCAWYCHADGKCYVPDLSEPFFVPDWLKDNCSDWTSDGLSNMERDELDAFVTMEKTSWVCNPRLPDKFTINQTQSR